MLVGRGAELATLTDRIDRGQPVVVVGDAGVGKTALLRAAAAQAGKQLLEGGSLATLSWMPYLAVERALGRRLPTADATWVAGELQNAGEGKVLLLDDLQWSDAGTRSVLGLVSQRLPSLGAARTAEPDSDAVIDELTARGFERIDLQPLDESSATDLARGLRPDLSSTAVARVLRRAGGNPLLIEELVSTDEPSDTLRLAVAARLRRLGPHVRDAMALLALAGRPLEAADVGPSSDALVDAGLAVRDNSHVALRHALLGEVLSDELDEAERMGLHARLAEVTTDPGLAARHHAAAGQRDQARAKAMVAADASGDVPERARHLLVAAECSQPDEAAVQRSTAAKILTRAGEYGALDAIVDAVETDDPLMLAEVAHARAFARWARGDRAGATEAVDAGLALVDGTGTEVELSLRVARSQFYIYDGTIDDEVIASLEELCAFARRIGSPVHPALGVLAWALLRSGDARCTDVYREAIEDARRVGDVVSELRLTANLLVRSIWYRETDEPWIRPTLRVGLERAREHRLAVSEQTFRIWEQAINLAEGRYDEVVSELRSILDQPIERQWRNNAITTFVPALIHTGRLDEALVVTDRELEAPVRITDSLLVGKAWALYWSGRPREAIEAADACLAVPDGDPDVAASARCARCYACFDLGLDPGDTTGGGGRDASSAPETEAIAMLARGGDPARAAVLLGKAVDSCGDVGESVRLMWSSGEALRLAGDENGARQRLAEAEAKAQSLGMRSVLDRIRRSLRLLGEHRAAARVGGGADLTARQREILGLVADGLNNAEIARRLGLSRSTVVRQISSALTKLGAKTRAQAAVLASQK